MRLSDLQNKDIVNMSDGKRVGKIIDVVIDEAGNMLSLIIQRTKLFNMIPNNNESEVKWSQIKKIGEDVILIDLK